MNLGIYRQQVIGSNRVIMRWLAHRGGALDFRQWRHERPGEPFPVSVALGADPATMLAAVTPIPDTLSEFAFAGLLRGSRTELVEGELNGLPVPASAEIVLEGHIAPDDEAPEGPFGDHTGYYNEVERFPVFTIARIHHRTAPIYHSTYTGRPPDEPAVLGVALNEVFVPLLQKQFPEITDFYLPPEGCSYRVAIVGMRKQYAGHAKRVMLGVWSYLRQFMYTKLVIVTDDDIDVRDWEDVVWALSTRVDPARDTTFIERSPIDYLDFASPVAGLGSKMGIDATSKWPGETDRAWGRPITMSQEVKDRVGRDVGCARNRRLRVGLDSQSPSKVSIHAGIRDRLRRLASRNHLENDDMESRYPSRVRRGQRDLQLRKHLQDTLHPDRGASPRRLLPVSSVLHRHSEDHGHCRPGSTSSAVDTPEPDSDVERRAPPSRTRHRTIPPAARIAPLVPRRVVSGEFDPGTGTVLSNAESSVRSPRERAERLRESTPHGDSGALTPPRSASSNPPSCRAGAPHAGPARKVQLESKLHAGSDQDRLTAWRCGKEAAYPHLLWINLWTNVPRPS